MLERAAYFVVKSGGKKCKYHQALVEVSEGLYLEAGRRPHPIVGMHWYQMGKMYSYSGDYQNAVKYLEKALGVIEVYYGLRCKSDGVMVNARLVMEVTENLMANRQLLLNETRSID